MTAVPISLSLSYLMIFPDFDILHSVLIIGFKYMVPNSSISSIIKCNRKDKIDPMIDCGNEYNI